MKLCIYEATHTPQLIIMMAFNSLTTDDCMGYITHASYNIRK